MRRIRQWAVVAAWLALSATATPACQLSITGPVTQQPLTYNPFQAGAAMAEVSFTVRNGGSRPCDAAFAFFRLGATQAWAGGNSALNYRVLGASGPAILGAISPPATLSDGSIVPHFIVGAKQTYTAHAIVSVGDGQVVGPAIYTDQLTLGLYHKARDGIYRKAAEAPLIVTISVNSQMTLTVAGGGRRTTVNFGDFVDGATRSVQLLAYSNQGFHLVVSSDNAGVMKPIDPVAMAEGQWRVPYTIAVNRTAPVDLSQQKTISLGQGATTKSGLAIPIDVQIGSTKGQRAGFYRDVITVAIDAGL